MKALYRNIHTLLIPNERRRFLLLIFLNFIISVADILSIAFLFFVVNFYAPQGFSVNIHYLSSLFPDKQSLLPAVILVIVFLFKSIGGYYINKIHYRFINDTASRISAENLTQFLNGNYTAHINNDSSALVRKICFLPVEFAHYVLHGVQQVITETMLIILSVTALLLYDFKLLLIVSLVLLPAAALLSYITKNRLNGIRKNINESNEHNLQYLNEALNGFVESNVYGKNHLFTSRYRKAQKIVNNYVADMQIVQGMPSRFFEAFAICGLFILIAAKTFVNAGNIASLFTLGAFVAAAYKIIPGISRIINLAGLTKTYSYTLNELVKINNEKQALQTNQTVETLNSIAFKNVSFVYNDKTILQHFNCTATTGLLIGIKGVSGKGKTTLVNLLLGFLTPSEGIISFNGMPVSPEAIKAYRSRIAYVKQEPFILHDSVLKNITLLESDYDRDKFEKVIVAAGLKEFISSFPEGIEKVINENGKNISGGQRQRIAIARALYKNADLVILDEPFNELDEPAELELMQYFKTLALSGKIVLLITHNSSSIHLCNNIISLDE